MKFSLSKRYTSPLAWAVWLLLELPAMLFGMLFVYLGRACQFVSGLIVRHVYYVFVRLARWVDGKPGWREQDAWIGIPNPAEVISQDVGPPEYADFFKESIARGEQLLTGLNANGQPWLLSDVKHFSVDDRIAICNALTCGGEVPMVSAVPPSVTKVE